MSDKHLELEREIRVLQRKLQRSDTDRELLEDTKEKTDSMLRKSIQELEQSRNELQAKSSELELTISELRDTQHELIQSAKMAALGELVAGVSHEINTPLGIGVTAASLLKSRVVEVRQMIADNGLTRSAFERFMADTEEAAEILLTNLQRGADLIQSFKLVAVDQSKASAREIEVDKYIDEILLSVSTALKRARLSIEVDGEQDLIMCCDPGSLAQVITNLAMNAVMHAYDEEEQGTLRLSYRAEGEDLVLRFADDGKGIPPEHLDKIYNPFFTTRRGTGGSGLGLNIIFNIVTAELGGTIDCHSEPGRGTEFVIRLPGVTRSQQARQQSSA